jgi:hypothetical protein
MRLPGILSILAAATLAGACAASIEAQGESAETVSGSTPVDLTGLRRDCFRVRDARDFEVLNRVNIIVYGPGNNRAWLVEIAPPSVNLRNSTAVVFETGGTGNRICGRAGDRLIVGRGSGQRSGIVDVRRLEPADLERILAEFGRGSQPPAEEAAPAETP